MDIFLNLFPVEYLQKSVLLLSALITLADHLCRCTEWCRACVKIYDAGSGSFVRDHCSLFSNKTGSYWKV